MVGTALAWLLGSCLLLLQPELPPAWSPAAVGLTALALAALSRRPACLGFAAGFALAWLQCAERLDARLDPSLEGTTLALAGRIASVPQATGDGLRFRFAPEPRPGVPRLVELSWYEPGWRPGAAELLDVEVRLRRPRGFANPGGTDLEARLLREGIGATGYVRSAARRPGATRDVLRYPVLVARDGIHDALSAALGERPATGIVAGLAVGLQGALSPEQWRELSRSGTSHLMAISGMHVGMFALLAAWVAAQVQRWRQRRGAAGAARDAAVLAGSLAALAYASLAGWSVPAQRTAVMIAIVALALRARRRAGAADVLAMGAIVVLLLEPLAPLAPGFWLSFGAVAAILLVTSGQLVAPGLARGYLQAQWAVSAGLVPVLAGSFGAVSLAGVAVNAVAIPLYTLLVVPAVLLATALVLVAPSAGRVALAGVAWLIETTWPIIAVPASWSFATWGVAGLAPLAWCALVAGALAALAPLPAPGRVAALLLATAACAWRPSPPDWGAARLALLDVGQGMAAVVETQNHVLVYDSGPAFRSGNDTGAIVVEPYLRHRGRRRIDMLVASHDDLDHAGGAATLAARLPVVHRVASGTVLDPLGRAERCRRGRQWRWDGVDFEWLHPAADGRLGENEGSCVLRVRVGPHVVLLTGDIERRAEAELWEHAPPGRVDVLTVPHHGSRTSSTPAFVEATRPRWALVPAGHRNRWGFPRADVVRRWEEAGATVLVTAATGAVEFELHPARPLTPPQLSRPRLRRSWHDP